MTGEAAERDRDVGDETPKSRPVRADVQRNLDALLKAAMAVFAASGVDAPVREIADAAKVGVGTVYRHFPQRSGPGFRRLPPRGRRLRGRRRR